MKFSQKFTLYFRLHMIETLLTFRHSRHWKTRRISHALAVFLSLFRICRIFSRCVLFLGIVMNIKSDPIETIARGVLHIIILWEARDKRIKSHPEDCVTYLYTHVNNTRMIRCYYDSWWKVEQGFPCTITISVAICHVMFVNYGRFS